MLPAPLNALSNAHVAPVVAPADDACSFIRSVIGTTRSANRPVDVLQPEEIGPGQISSISSGRSVTSSRPSLIALIAGLLVTATASIANANQLIPQNIEIFSTSKRPVHADPGRKQSTYHLDALSLLEQALSQDLPSDPDKAKALALERVAAMEQALQDDVENAVEGLSLATAYGLRQLPAIVFDKGRYVVYGVENLERAIIIYQDFKKS